MATNDIPISISENSFAVPLTVSDNTPTRTASNDNASPYYVGARAYVTPTVNGAVITIIDKDGTTTATILNGINGLNGQDGEDGADGVGIERVTLTSTSGNIDTYTIFYTDGTTDTFDVTNGVDGQDGRDGTDGVDGVGIVSIEKTATVGLVDTYTITLTDGSTTTFTVTNGEDGAGTVQDVTVDGVSVLVDGVAEIDLTGKADVSDIPTKTSDLTNDSNFVSDASYVHTDNNYTTAEKTKLGNMSKVYHGTCDTAASTQEKVVVCPELTSLEEGIILFVKFSHAQSYNGTPSLNVNNLGAKNVWAGGATAIRYEWKSNEILCFVYTDGIWSIVDGEHATTTYYGVTKLSNSTSSTSQALAATPSAVKAAYDLANSKYKLPTNGIPKLDLASAVQTSLGLADTALQSETDPVFSASAASGITSSDIDNWDGKQDELVSGTNIRTINGTSILGSGDISVAAGGTPIPTADTVAEFDSDAHINSEDMTSQEVEDFLDGIDAQGKASEYKKLLWTNSSPTSAFGAQTISLDLSEYDAIEVESNYTTANTFGAVTQLFSVTDGKKQSEDVPQAQGTPRATRGIYAENAGVTFTAGGYVIGSTYTANDSYCIPLCIYGIKYERVAPIQVDASDYVVEQGTDSNGWYVRKWDSGYIEAQILITNPSWGSSSTANGVTRQALNIPTPPTMTSKLSVNASGANSGSWTNGFFDSNTVLNVMTYRISGSTTPSVVSIFVTGRWK